MHTEQSSLRRRRAEPSEQQQPVVVEATKTTPVLPVMHGMARPRRSSSRGSIGGGGLLARLWRRLQSGPLFLMSFHSVSIVLALIQLVCAILVVFYLRWSAKAMLTSLSNQLQGELAERIRQDVQLQMDVPVRTLSALRWSLEHRWPSLAHESTFSNRTGFAAELAYFARAQPSNWALGVANAKGALMYATREEGHPYGICDASTNFTLHMFGSPKHSPDERGAAFSRLTEPPHFSPMTPASEIMAAFGAPVLTVPNFDVRERPYYKYAQKAWPKFGWLRAFSSMSLPTGHNQNGTNNGSNSSIKSNNSNSNSQRAGVTSSSSSSQSPSQLPPSSGDRNAVGRKVRLAVSAVLASHDRQIVYFCGIAESFLRNVLSTVPVGSNGVAMVLDNDTGELVASSRVIEPLLLEPVLHAMHAMGHMKSLRGGGSNNSATASPSAAIVAAAAVPVADKPSCSTLRWRNDDYELLVRAADVPELSWSIVILSLPSDFEMSHAAFARTSGLIGFAVLCMGIVASFLLVRLFGHPLAQLADFMHTVGATIGHDSGIAAAVDESKASIAGRATMNSDASKSVSGPPAVPPIVPPEEKFAELTRLWDELISKRSPNRSPSGGTSDSSPQSSGRSHSSSSDNNESVSPPFPPPTFPSPSPPVQQQGKHARMRSTTYSSTRVSNEGGNTGASVSSASPTKSAESEGVGAQGVNVQVPAASVNVASLIASTPTVATVSKPVLGAASTLMTSLQHSLAMLLGVSGEIPWMPLNAAWLNLAQSVRVSEIQQLEFSFSSMLHQISASHAALVAVNNAKRHFIRYIFHEIRVPFNAVVLAIAELERLMDVTFPATVASSPLSSSPSPGTQPSSSSSSSSSRPPLPPGAAATTTSSFPSGVDPSAVAQSREILSILTEQSDVVVRTLNDVLSVQRIEEGALKLEYAPFCFEQMVRSTLKAFQSATAEKKLHVTLDLQDLSEFMASLQQGHAGAAGSGSIAETHGHDHFIAADEPHHRGEARPLSCPSSRASVAAGSAQERLRALETASSSAREHPRSPFVTAGGSASAVVVDGVGTATGSSSSPPASSDVSPGGNNGGAEHSPNDRTGGHESSGRQAAVPQLPAPANLHIAREGERSISNGANTGGSRPHSRLGTGLSNSNSPSGTPTLRHRVLVKKGQAAAAQQQLAAEKSYLSPGTHHRALSVPQRLMDALGTNQATGAGATSADGSHSMPMSRESSAGYGASSSGPPTDADSDSPLSQHSPLMGSYSLAHGGHVGASAVASGILSGNASPGHIVRTLSRGPPTMNTGGRDRFMDGNTSFAHVQHSSSQLSSRRASHSSVGSQEGGSATFEGHGQCSHGHAHGGAGSGFGGGPSVWSPLVHKRRVNTLVSPFTSPGATPPSILQSMGSMAPAPARAQPHCVGDMYRLRQVLANYYSNAVKFTRAGGKIVVRLRFSVATEEQANALSNEAKAAGAKAAAALAAKAAAAASSAAQFSPQGSPPTPSGDVSLPLLHVSGATVSSPGSSPVPPSPSPSLPLRPDEADEIDHSNAAPAPDVKPLPVILFHLSVIDDGIGVPDEEQSKLFSPFVQLSSGVSQQKGKGSGLGLSIARSLILLHGGTIGYRAPKQSDVLPFSPSPNDEDLHSASSPVSPDGATSAATAADALSMGGESGMASAPQSGSFSGASVTSPAPTGDANAPRASEFFFTVPMQVLPTLPPPVAPSSSTSIALPPSLSSRSSIGVGMGGRSHIRHRSFDMRAPFDLNKVGSTTSTTGERTASRRASHSASGTSSGGSSRVSPTTPVSPSVSGYPETSGAASSLASAVSPSWHSSMAPGGVAKGEVDGNLCLYNHSKDPTPAGTEATTYRSLAEQQQHHARQLSNSQANTPSLLSRQGGLLSPSPPPPHVGVAGSSGVTNSDSGTNLSTSPPSMSSAAMNASALLQNAAWSSGTNATNSAGTATHQVSNSAPVGQGPCQMLHPSANLPPRSPFSVVRRLPGGSTPTSSSRSLSGGSGVAGDGGVFSPSGGAPSGSPSSSSRALPLAVNTTPVIPASFSSPTASTTPASVESAPAATTSSLASHAAAASVLSPPASAPLTSASAAGASSLSTPASAPPPLRVLVVEDSLPNLKLLMMMVRSLGYTVSGAEHGGLCVDQFEAAKRAREEAGLPAPGPDDPPGQGWPADCVLLDGSMPVLNGPQTASHLRGMGVQIPIIAVTGNALADDMQSFLDAGADMVLTKPIRIDAIKSILAKVARPTDGTQ